MNILYHSGVKIMISKQNILIPEEYITDDLRAKENMWSQMINPAKSTKLRLLEVNGYIEPTLEKSDLDCMQDAFALLTYLSIFGYQVKEDGTLTSINDNPLIHMARKNKVAPLMVVTNYKEGIFDTNLAHHVLSNYTIRSKLIDKIIDIVISKNYHGVHMDFENLYLYDKGMYHEFLSNLKYRLSRQQLILTTALSPNFFIESGESNDSQDFITHGTISDFTILTTYGWGWAGGPPYPIAPINEVTQNIVNALSIISPDKIMMGIPLYGYDWLLPYKSKNPRANAISLQEAVQLADFNKTVIHYDFLAQSPYFNYFDNADHAHIVWFENEKSVRAKYEMVHELDLRGVSFWSLATPFPENWEVLNEFFDIKKIIT